MQDHEHTTTWDTGPGKVETCSSLSGIEEAISDLFGAVERAEKELAAFIVDTEDVRVESGTEIRAPEKLQQATIISPLEVKINNVTERIRQMEYRITRTRAELRL